MQQPLPLLIKNATIFWEHEVCIDCCHCNTATYIFFLGFFSKQCENNGKNYSYILDFICTYFILSSVCYNMHIICYYWYKIRPITCITNFEIFKKINFYPHKFLVKPTFARILLHVKFVNILK